MKKLLVALSLIFSVNIYSDSQDNSATEVVTIKKATKQENLEEIFNIAFDKTFVSQVFDGLKPHFPFDSNAEEILAEFVDKFHSEENRKKLMNLFDDIFTDKEVEELLAF